jgi:hypothetical protein
MAITLKKQRGYSVEVPAFNRYFLAEHGITVADVPEDAHYALTLAAGVLAALRTGHAWDTPEDAYRALVEAVTASEVIQTEAASSGMGGGF